MLTTSPSRLQNSGLITWDEFVEGVRTASERANGSMVIPMTEYKSAAQFHKDLVKHTRRRTGPQQQYKQPMLSSQVVGWTEGLMVPVGETRFRHRSTDLSQFAAASGRVDRGQSPQHDMTSLGKASVSADAGFAGFGMGF